MLRASRQHIDSGAAMGNVEFDNLRTHNTQLKAEVERLTASLALAQQLGRILDLPQLARELAACLPRCTHFPRALVLVMDESGSALRFGASSEPLPEDRVSILKQFLVSTHNHRDNQIIRSWNAGRPVEVSLSNAGDSSPLPWLIKVFERGKLFSVPLVAGSQLAGVVLVQQPEPAHDALEADRAFIEHIAPIAAIAIENARLHSKTVDELDAKMRQLYMMRQLDHELNETIKPDHVFDMTLDWAMRYTGAHAASLALYDRATGELRYVADLGYELPREKLIVLRSQGNLTPAHRAAQSGRTAVIPNVLQDPDYLRLSPTTASQLCAPIMREERVIAVIVLESKRLNAFTEDHVAFVHKLGARAGVAIDNARLFAEAVRQREKLSHILSNTADVVIVVNNEGRVDLINESALAALQLKPDKPHIGRLYEEVLRGTVLLEFFRRAMERGEETVAETLMPGDRIFHANLARHENVGWILVMHDITPLKETDRLKSELVATVSHDLKQPLSVMQGYTELLLMNDWHEPDVTKYARMIQRSIGNMRQLIDDLLDLAKIESGVQFDPEPIQLHGVIHECLEAIRKIAESKGMDLHIDIPDTLPPVRGERGYLNQIFANLVTNAVKYTAPQGKVRIWAEPRGDSVRIAVQDSGLGISPEDQARIFDRFYRVRRPETDSIDGTGLGLAIVKRLIEIHNGQIGLSSRLGEGSTFYVTLPIYTPLVP